MPEIVMQNIESDPDIKKITDTGNEVVKRENGEKEAKRKEIEYKENQPEKEEIERIINEFIEVKTQGHDGVIKSIAQKIKEMGEKFVNSTDPKELEEVRLSLEKLNAQLKDFEGQKIDMVVNLREHIIPEFKNSPEDTEMHMVNLGKEITALETLIKESNQKNDSGSETEKQRRAEYEHYIESYKKQIDLYKIAEYL